MTYDVHVTHLAAQPILSIRSSVLHEAVMDFYQDGQAELQAYAESAGVAITGPSMSLWYSGPHDSPTHTDIETAVPVAYFVPARGHIHCRELPAGRVVSTVHHGSYDDLGNAFDAVWRFIEQHHETPAGPPRDLVLIGPKNTDTIAEYQTEVVWPIA